MRSHRIPRLGAAGLAGIVLLGFLMPITAVQAASTPRAALLPPSAQPPVVLGYDDGVAEVRVAEAILLLVSILGCGLLVLGLEALDLWRERRAERRRPRTSVAGGAARGTMLDA